MLIQLYPSNILLQKSTNVEVFDDKLRETVTNMVVIMRKLRGLGLAAPQVGINKNFFVMESGEQDEGDDPLLNIDVIVNPRIVLESTTKILDSEGCLSFPGIFENIKRSSYVVVEYCDLAGNKIEREYKDRLARCFLHEFEHLQGEVFIQHVSALKRDMVKRKMTKINALLGRG